MRTSLRLLAVSLVGAAACARPAPPVPLASIAAEPGERHLHNIRQLTNGGENAEAYFSADGRRLVFQSTRDGRSCDQEYVMNVDGSGLGLAISRELANLLGGDDGRQATEQPLHAGASVRRTPCSRRVP